VSIMNTGSESQNRTLKCDSQRSAAPMLSASHTTHRDCEISAGLCFGSTGKGEYINTVMAGPLDAPPVVLVHGYGAGTGFWFKNIPELASKYR
jgi:pimeloyl-ACP methyl ester carboxylesterase